MRAIHSLTWFGLGTLLIGSCHSGNEATPAVPANSGNPAVATSTASAANSASAKGAAAQPAPGDSSWANGYVMCQGESKLDTAATARSGPVSAQLAPAYLDQMAECRPEDAFPRSRAEQAGEGKVNAKGDCEYAAIGVSCHYHSGSEFVNTSSARQTPGQGELHCIFPSADPKSPVVYGSHIVCRDHAQGEPHPHAAALAHEVHSGAQCSAALLEQLAPCHSSRCCDDGTLTNPIAELQHEGRNDVRPDFRICEQALAIDCDLLASLTPHPANSPALGGVGEIAFELSAVAGPPLAGMHQP